MSDSSPPPGATASAPRTPPRNVPGLTPRLRGRLQRFFALATRLSPEVAARLALQLFMTPPRRRVEEQDKPVLAAATRHALRIRSSKVSVYEWPPAGASGVLLLHGWGSHAARFGSFVLPLQAAGLRPLGLDAPAHGASTGRRSDLGKFRESIELTLQRFAPIQSIVAHSFGASAAIWSAAEQPHPELRSAVIMGMPRDVGYMMESFELVLGLRTEVRMHLRRLFARRFGTTPEKFSTHALADRLKLPILVVHDEDDDVAPIEHAQQFAERLTSGRLHMTRGLNHSGPLRDPATITSAIAFICAQA